MKSGLLPLLACPDCAGEIGFAAPEKHPRGNEEVEAGTLACRACRREFSIVEGIPRLHPRHGMAGRVRKTGEAFAWEWLRHPGPRPDEDRAIFLEETQIPEDAWSGRRALDAGCGMGRYARVSLSLGAEVVAFDLSDSLLRLLPEARRNPKLHLVQGDLHAPPFKKGVFDIVYSQGVIHHTSDTRLAFDRISTLVARDGLLSVWVYGAPGSYRSFSTNPLRPGREGLRRALPLVWLVVCLRTIVSDLLRVVTTRLPVPLLYAVCHPITWLGVVPGVKYLTFSVHPDFGVRLTENFDWLAPPFQSKHTKEEVRPWFVQAGFDVLSQLPHGMIPKIGFLGRKSSRPHGSAG